MLAAAIEDLGCQFAVAGLSLQAKLVACADPLCQGLGPVTT